MARSAGVSGVAVAMAAAGGLLLWTGIVNRPIREALQDLLKGRAPGTSGAPTGPALADVSTDLDRGGPAGRWLDPEVAPASSGSIAVFVDTARAQLGKPYVWGAAGPDAFDCSGLVTFCLKRAGLDNQRRVTAQYLVWTGAYSIARDQCALGDLVCWSGHIGIAVSRDRMIHAPSAGRPVQEGTIWSQPPPVIRRIAAGTEGQRGPGIGTPGPGAQARPPGVS